MPYSSWFQCIDTDCSERMSLTEIVYTCPRCDGLLMVAHDIDALKNRSGAAWMRLFDDRYMTTQFPYGSGVWGKKEWVYPQIDDANIVSTYEGGSNLFQGHTLRGDDRRPGPLDQAVRQQSHRVVQGPRHDGARLGRPADDPRGRGHPRGDLRLHRRHLRRRRRLLRHGGHPIRRPCSRRTRSPRHSSCSLSPTTR